MSEKDKILIVDDDQEIREVLRILLTGEQFQVAEAAGGEEALQYLEGPAPHGAGRLYSRSAAKEKFTLEEFEKEMEGIYTTSIHPSTLDECPMAYKNAEDIVNNITPTADIIKMIKPVYNFKAGS